MNNELLFLIKNIQIGWLNKQRQNHKKTLEYILNKEMETSSFTPPINLLEEGKWLLAVTSIECLNSVFIITDENSSFSITIPGHWDYESAEKTIDELNKVLELKSQNGIELHVEQVKQKYDFNIWLLFIQFWYF